MGTTDWSEIEALEQTYLQALEANGGEETEESERLYENYTDLASEMDKCLQIGCRETSEFFAWCPTHIGWKTETTSTEESN